MLLSKTQSPPTKCYYKCMDVRSLIGDYLVQAIMMHIGTCHGGNPWVTTVYFASDTNLNLYFLSRKNRRHSREISNNNHVAGAIVLPHNYGDKVRGIQFEGKGRELGGEEAEGGRSIYQRKFWIVEDRVLNQQEGVDLEGVFQIVPERYVLFDELNFPANPSQELKM